MANGNIAQYIRAPLSYLGTISGENFADEVPGNIFSISGAEHGGSIKEKKFSTGVY